MPMNAVPCVRPRPRRSSTIYSVGWGRSGKIDRNTFKGAIRPVTLNRKNALFAGHDEGAAAWGLIASLIETCKLNGVEPQRYLTNVLTKIAQQWPMAKLDQLLPWAHVA